MKGKCMVSTDLYKICQCNDCNYNTFNCNTATHFTFVLGNFSFLLAKTLTFWIINIKDAAKNE